MGILADYQLRALCENDPPLITPFTSELVNPASVDVRLGPHIMIEAPGTDGMVRASLNNHTKDDPYILQPGQFILAETIETFNLPNDVAAQFMLKSSRAREGLEHLMAGYCDPGWHGSRLTMELHNSRQHAGVALWPGMKIGQMVFHRMESLPLRSYAETGRYNNDQTVMGSKG